MYLKKNLICWFCNVKSLSLLIIFIAFSAQPEEGNDYPISEKVQKIEQYLNESEKRGFSGAVLVSYKGEVLLNEAYGYADKKAKISATTDMVYDIGSLTKQFTAAAILQLVREGKLSTNDTLSQFFDGLPEDKKKITLHQLLTHTSGISPHYVEFGRNVEFVYTETNEFFRRVFSEKLKFEPGSKYEYENVGYAVLGRVIELVSNEDYEVFLNRVFFKPLGMTQTGYLLPDWDPSLFPKGYLAGKVEKDTSIPKYQKANKISWRLKGNGGIYSTVSDMHKWMSALANHEVLSQELINLLIDDHVEIGTSGNTFYGYGWVGFYSQSNIKYVEHAGSNSFFYSRIFWKQNEEQLQVIMLSNMYSKHVTKVPPRIVVVWNDKEYSPNKFRKSFWGPLIKCIAPVFGLFGY